MFVDSHTHLYLESFSDDRDKVIERAIKNGVTKMFLPNIDSRTIQPLCDLADSYRDNCFPMMGLHPGSVNENYKKELIIIEKQIQKRDFIAIGEIGIDLYRNKTFLNEQEAVFTIQIEWAKNLGLPIVIHARDSFKEIFKVLDKLWEPGLRGVFHSFTGNRQEAKRALSYDFFIGINGIVTFKNNDIAEIVEEIPINLILLETDAPFLSPVPFRGKRNESSYLIHIAGKISEIHKLSIGQVAEETTRNANNLFIKR